jgi:hypothetical protein
MTNEEKQNLLKKYSSAKLTDVEMQRLEKAVEEGYIELDELENFQEIQDHYNIDIDALWTGRVDEVFYNKLNQNKRTDDKGKIFSLVSWVPLGIAASLLFMIGIWIGKNNDSPVVVPNNNASNEMVFATQLEETKNISQRIHLIASKDDQALDQKIIKTLMYTLNTDESSNVRIACIEILSEYTHHSVVREGLISSIKFQVSPAVINNLVDAIKKGGSKLSNEDYKLKLNKEIPEPLRNSIEESINKI